jgi:hypothetical protein
LITVYALGASTLHEWVYLHIACRVRPGLECTIDLVNALQIVSERIKTFEIVVI